MINNLNINKTKEERQLYFQKVARVLSNDQEYYINKTDSIFESFRLIREIDLDNDGSIDYDNKLFELIKKIKEDNGFSFYYLIQYLNEVTIKVYKDIEDTFLLTKELNNYNLFYTKEV